MEKYYLNFLFFYFFFIFFNHYFDFMKSQAHNTEEKKL